MDEISKLSCDILDQEGVAIHLGDMILYQGYEYIVLEGDKENNPWICHPCGGNPGTEDLMLEEIASEVLVAW